MTDYLSRQPYLDLLKSIITNQCNNPTGYSFAIDGKWGSGKTWIVNELERQLAADTKMTTVNTCKKIGRGFKAAGRKIKGIFVKEKEQEWL